MDKRFITGTVFGLGLGLALGAASPMLIAAPTDIQINKNKKTINNSSYTGDKSSSADKNSSDTDQALLETSQKILAELKELNDTTSQNGKTLGKIEANVKALHPFGGINDSK